MVKVSTILRDTFRLLTFRMPGPAIRAAWPAYLAFGLLVTWMAGVGRYWDNPRAEWWQTLGLGSLAYVVVLAVILWAIAWPFKPDRWSYRSVLIFVTLTAPPALLYAIPVERFMTPAAATSTNAWFLAVVAAWRVGLWAFFLKQFGGLGGATVWVLTLLPLTLIVVALTMLNLEHVVFNIMSGIRPEQQSANDGAYGVVLMLAFFSVLASPVLLIAYLVLMGRASDR